jgi:ribosomal protein S18 acetylase RimI-like enzyme
MDAAQIWHHAKTFGAFNALVDLSLRAINRLFLFKILRVVVLEAANLQAETQDSKFRFEFLDESTLRRFATCRGYELSSNFLDWALSRKDRCYGIFDGTTLTSYGWFSAKPTRIEPPDLILRFDHRFGYVYKLFTHPDYRGRRLVAMGLTHALAASLTSGLAGLVAIVESNNFSSRKAMRRVGALDVGKIYVGRIFGSYLIHSDAGSRRYQCRLDPVREEK